MIKGIDQNFTPEGTPEGFAFFTKNVIINQKLNEVFNEKGTSVINAFNSANVSVVNGVITFGDKVIVFYTEINPDLVPVFESGPPASFSSLIQPGKTHNFNVYSNFELSLTSNFNYTPPNYKSNILYKGCDLTIGTSVEFGIQKLLHQASGLTLTGLFTIHCLDVDKNIIYSQTQTNPDDTVLISSIPEGTTYIGISVSGTSYNTSDKVALFGFYGIGTLRQTYSIGVWDEKLETFTTRIKKQEFAFDPDYPISGKAKFNSVGNLVVAFTDKHVTPKYVNLDTAEDGDDISLYDLNLSSGNLTIAASPVESGGSLKTGAWFAVAALGDKNKAYGNWSSLSNVTYIVESSITDAYNKSQGTLGGVPSSKGIKLTISNINLAFKYIKIALISRQEGVYSSKIYKEVTIDGPSVTITINGGELTTDVSISELLTQNQVYNLVGELESLADQLFLADVETTEIVDFQKLANKLEISWKSTLISDIIKTTNTRYTEDGNKRTFLHDEVYAIYVQFEKTEGGLTEWFTVPGNPLTPQARADTVYANSIKIDGNTPKVFQLEWYGFGASSSTVGVYARGKTGCWENESELYPEGFPDFAGQKVRHHKMPSSSFLQAFYNSPMYLTRDWDVLDLTALFTEIPLEFINKFKSFKLGYAKRDINNSTVIGYDIVELFGTNTFETGYTGLGGNWAIQATGNNNDFTITTPDKKYLRLHSPDILMLRPSISNLYLKQLGYISMQNINNPTGTFGGGNYYTGTGGVPIYTYITDYSQASGFSFIFPFDRYLKLSEGAYIPNNSKVDTPSITINNLLNEEFVYFKAEKPLEIYVSGVSDGGYFKVDIGPGVDSPDLRDDTILIMLKAPKSDLFVNYQDQQVIPINNVIKNPVINTPYDFDNQGDGFICFHSFLTAASAPANDQPYNFADDKGIRCIKRFLCESRFNLNQRYQITGDSSTYFYPISSSNRPQSSEEMKSSWIGKLLQTNLQVNNIKYSKDFNTLNDLEQYGVYNHLKTYTSQLPFAIARSLKSRRDNDLDDGWRQFKPNDIFYTVRDKGKIINLQAWGTDNLLIHHEYALLKTRDKAVLQTDITTISLGSGDLFTLEPQEISPTQDGYGGTQHKFSCRLTKAGYCFVDANAGEVFIYNGEDSFAEISKGFRLFFREVFRNNAIGDNPLNGTGIVFAFDSENYRLVLSLKANSDISFTATFDLIKQEWVGLTDYKPDFIFNTRKKLYSFKDRVFNSHGTGPYGSFYGIVYPSFVDVVVNEEPAQEKILQAIRWISRVVSNGGTKAQETITSVTVWNDYYCTDKIDIHKRDNLTDYESKNARQVDGVWGFDDLFDVVKNADEPFIDSINSDYRPIPSNISNDLAWFEKAPLRGKYFIIRLEYSNIEDKLVSLRSVLFDLKRSYQ